MIDNLSKGPRNAISVKEAQQRILSQLHLGGNERIDLSEARGRYLAETILAPHPYPHFRRAGMDGFAIISQDTCGAQTDQPVWLEIVDEIPAGALPSISLESGLASRIMTGAKVPDEADAVVMFEMTEQIEQGGRTTIQIKREIEPGKNITPIGFEIKQDDLLIKEGTRISSGEISVLATFGIHQVLVYKKPVVAIFSTGSELLDIDEALQDGKIRNSNAYMLACQIRDAGGEVIILDAIPDDLQIAKARVTEAFELYDMVVTTGGVSVGDFDIMADLVQGEELTLLFNKVTMRPGSVTTAAVRGRKLLFALSGNPGACFVGCEMFVRPAIGVMQGKDHPFLKEITGILATDFNKINNFTRFVRGHLAYEEGQVLVYPASLDESSVMVTIKDSDCLIVIPPVSQAVPKGQKVQVLLLDGSGIL
ncbi:molybdopterin molybdotransferase [Paenibacillus shirakamiensis]|uniref:Molybdopterin molybdenumtransferase n=1 Tax=Paenibacillus shirakamiensis TaxID=1265935 RepID=A0ABS4JDN1_9BACL|nr:gephyrin-like molybdotransferase Glp [Paenibacillus shirakamiensis]MBP1999842.1 molybdopterin molybdotransferase [Paenibacillus shirakamiensis]